ncbi:MAG: hypothetical protein LBO79_01245 [Zoogloeaceae bacterium]|nr:hypothetical protein [Zoogloeaceae bacterium]
MKFAAARKSRFGECPHRCPSVQRYNGIHAEGAFPLFVLATLRPVAGQVSRERDARLAWQHA